MSGERTSSFTPPEPPYRSTCATHEGAVRRLNRDKTLERDEIGLWAVIDAMGGDSSPGIGSAAVTQALARVERFESHYAGRRSVRAVLTDVNERLFMRASEERLLGVGASAVVLLNRLDQYACMWVGNARAYLFRAGVLQRITSDHMLAGLPMQAFEEGWNPVLTRAIGAQPKLDIDAVGGDLMPGDRFLLCSDGLTILTDEELAELMAITGPAGAINAMIERALAAGAPDNVTALIVDVVSTAPPASGAGGLLQRR